MIDQSLVGFMHNYQVLCSLLSMSADVGRKLQSCREEEEEHENAQECSDPNLSLQKNPPSLPQKQRKYMPFHKHPSDQQLVSSTTSDFRVSIESHAESTKATQSFLSFLCTIIFPIIES
jgi:hypothetical protein